MMTFYILILFLLLYLYLCKYRYNTSAKVFIIIATVVLILVSGLRHEGVGDDTCTYSMIYDNVKYSSWDDILNNFFQRAFTPSAYEERDPGLNVLIKVMHSIGLNYRYFLFFIALFLLIPLGILIYQFSDNLKTVLYGYVFYVAFFYGYLPNSAIRQSLALSFIIWAYLFIKDRKLFLAVLMVLIGATFHISALAVLLLYPFIYIRQTKLFYYLTFPTFFLVLVFHKPLLVFLLGEESVYGDYLGSYYMDNMQEKPFRILLLMMAHYLLCFLYIRQLGNLERKNRIIILGSIFAITLSPLIWVNPTVLRIVSYFGIFLPILTGKTISCIRYGTVILFSLILLYLYQSDPKNNNYRFMWQQMELPDTYYDNRR